MASTLRRIVLRIMNVLGPGRGEPDLARELRAHLTLLEDEFRHRGMSAEEARLAAKRAFGNVERTKETHRDARSFVWLDDARRDLRYALRTLRRSPGFSAVAILTLALGIGTTTAIFSLLDAVILRDLPVRSPEELVRVERGGLYPVFLAFRRQTDIFADLCATSGVTRLDVEVQSGIRERTDVSLVSGSYFSTLGVQAPIGRVFTTDDDRVPEAHPVAVASYGYFQRQFGGDVVTVLQRTIRIRGTPVTIIGVAPPGFFGEHVGQAPDLWIPLTMWGQIVPGRNLLENPATDWLEMIGRVRPGVATSGVQPTLTGLFRQVATGIFGPGAPADVRRDIASAVVRFEPAGTGLPSTLRSHIAHPLQLLMGAVVLVLLIACANIANLLLARAAARRREIDVRLAIGVSRARLLRQLLTESLVLAALGGTAGLAVARIGREALLRLVSGDGSRLSIAAPIDARLLLFVGIITFASAILFGFAPAWQSARQRESLIARERTGIAGLASRRLSSSLIIGQVAISVVLLTGAGLFLRTIANLHHVNLGFDPGHLLIVDTNPQAAGYRGERAVALNRRLLDRITALPGVSSVSVAEDGVLMGRDSSTNLMRPAGFVAGPAGFPRMHFDWVGPRYFATMGIPLVSGRDFTDRDDVGSTAVVAIDEEAATVFFAGKNPIGRRLLWGSGPQQQALEIVAVTDDVKQSGPRDAPQLRFYLPYFQMLQIRSSWSPASTRFLVRTAADPRTLAAPLRQVIPSEDPRLSIGGVTMGSDLVRQSVVQERAVAVLLVVFAVLAVALASVGLYGLIAYQVARRTSEIGIRMALGARGADVIWTILRGSVAWIAAGMVIGIPVALIASRLTQGLLFGVSIGDPSTLVAAVGVLFAVGVLASYLPARRVLRIDPAVALRGE
jgi:predicted permease